MDNEIEIFLYNLNYLRKHYGLSKDQMAKIIRTDTDNIDIIEQGELPKDLTIHAIFGIYKHFGITPKKQFTVRLN